LVLAFSIVICGEALGLYTVGKVFTQMPAFVHFFGFSLDCDFTIAVFFHYGI